MITVHISTIPIQFFIKSNNFSFQISLCEDLDELMEAFFRNFKADGVEQPHKLFTGSWRLPTAAQYLGLSAQALDDSVHSYVLVKLDRTKVRFIKIRLIVLFRVSENKVTAYMKYTEHGREGLITLPQRSSSGRQRAQLCPR